MTYVQGVDSLFAAPKNIAKDYGLIIQPDDQLAISVSSKDKELIAPFNNGTVINSGSNESYGSQANLQSGMTYFYVNKDGTIDFPVLGRINVKGLTIGQVSQKIQEQIRASYISDALVTTKIMSFKITVLGDVANPGTQSYTGQRLTLLEAIGRAGDLNNTAVRKNVLIVREENGKRVTFRVDLTNPESVFNSPAYYMQQNDLIYVESNKSVKVKGSTSYTYLTVSGTLVSMAASIISLIIALNK
jgi:polysaccharide export outer membrane protein